MEYNIPRTNVIRAPPETAIYPIEQGRRTRVQEPRSGCVDESSKPGRDEPSGVRILVRHHVCVVYDDFRCLRGSRAQPKWKSSTGCSGVKWGIRSTQPIIIGGEIQERAVDRRWIGWTAWPETANPFISAVLRSILKGEMILYIQSKMSTE